MTELLKTTALVTGVQADILLTDVSGKPRITGRIVNLTCREIDAIAIRLEPDAQVDIGDEVDIVITLKEPSDA